MCRPAFGLLLLCLAAAHGSQADVYRCEAPGESLRFVDDPSQCRSAAAQPLSRTLQRFDRVASDPAADAPGSDTGSDIGALFPRPGELGNAWQVVAEAPIDPAGDPDLAGWGVRALASRHFTRQKPGGSEVCSAEIWQFHDAALASRAHAEISYPGWQITRHGSRVLMLRGTVWQLGGRFEKGVFEGCGRIGRRLRSRLDAARDAAPAAAGDHPAD